MTLPIPLDLLPAPRLIAWHGEPGEDPATARVLEILHRTYRSLLDHRIAESGRTAGGSDWTGWHVEDPDLITGMADLVALLAPTHWTVTR